MADECGNAGLGSIFLSFMMGAAIGGGLALRTAPGSGTRSGARPGSSAAQHRRWLSPRTPGRRGARSSGDRGRRLAGSRRRRGRKGCRGRRGQSGAGRLNCGCAGNIQVSGCQVSRWGKGSRRAAPDQYQDQDRREPGRPKWTHHTSKIEDSLTA